MASPRRLQGDGRTLVEGEGIGPGLSYEIELPGDGDPEIEKAIHDEMTGRTVTGPVDAHEALQMLVGMVKPVRASHCRGCVCPPMVSITFTKELLERIRALAARMVSLQMPDDVHAEAAAILEERKP